MKKLAYRPVLTPPYVPARVLRERLESRLEDTPGGECIVWTGARNSQGFGVLRLSFPDRTRVVQVSSVVWFLAGRPWPPSNHQVRPTCGQPRCCAIAHLQIFKRLGRYPRQLTKEQAEELNELYHGPEGAPAHRQRFPDNRDPRRIAAEACGVGYTTAKRLLDMPEDYADKRLPELRRQHQLACEYTRERLASAAKMLTLHKLGVRYRVSACTLLNAMRKHCSGEPEEPWTAQRYIPDDALAAAKQVADEMMAAQR